MPMAHMGGEQQRREGAEGLKCMEDTRATPRSLFSDLLLRGLVPGSLAKAQGPIQDLSSVFLSSLQLLDVAIWRAQHPFMIQAGKRGASGIFFKQKPCLGFLLP